MGEYFVMDESDRPYADNECPYKFGLIDDLIYIQVCQKCNVELDPNSYLAKLKREIISHGLEITSDTDIKQLAVTVKLLGIA